MTIQRIDRGVQGLKQEQIGSFCNCPGKRRGGLGLLWEEVSNGWVWAMLDLETIFTEELDVLCE